MTGYNANTWMQECEDAFDDVSGRDALSDAELERLKVYLRTGVVSPRGIAHLINTVDWLRLQLRGRIKENQQVRKDRDSWQSSYSELRVRLEQCHKDNRRMMQEMRRRLKQEQA